MADVEDSTAKQDVWGAHLDAWKASGLSMRGYCLKEGIGLNGLRYWRDKVGESESRHKVVKLPVKLGLAEPMIEVVMGDRFTIRLPKGFQTQELKALIEVLERLR